MKISLSEAAFIYMRDVYIPRIPNMSSADKFRNSFKTLQGFLQKGQFVKQSGTILRGGRKLKAYKLTDVERWIDARKWRKQIALDK